MLTSPIAWMRRLLALAAGLICLLAIFQVQPAHAQPPTCNDVITQLDGALAPGVCDVLGLGSACLATRSVNATPRTGTIRFTIPGDEAQLNNIRQMITVPQKGAAVLLGGPTANPVKILIFGDTATSPNSTQPGRVFTLRASNGQPTCERTRSGMILQTPTGKNGTLVVNGVTIKLGSTAYVVPGADVLFDQDPRLDRRQGSRNRNAPLCSGFDSDCDFGDDSCSRSDRLVYGPFCREDTYPYIEPGLYRVTLYGEGEVQAGATDFNITHDFEMMGTQRLTLPDSYTFCWDGLQDGGTGFETIVQARSDDAFVDHITIDYLGHDCSLRGANDPSAGMGRGEMGVMSVYNIEGGVDVSMPDGQQASPDSGQRIRLYYEGDQVVAMDEGPTDAPYIEQSDLAQWASGATGGGLPEIAIRPGRPGTEPQPQDPVVSVNADVLLDGGYPYALRIEAQVYDPNVGSSNGDGIDHVDFTIRDSSGDVIFDNDEEDPAYCAYGGDSPCEESISSDSIVSGDYEVTATAYTDRGVEVSASTSFSLNWVPPIDSSSTTEVEPTIVPTEVPPGVVDAPPVFGPISSSPSGGYCFGDTISAGVDVRDDVSVAHVTLHWQALFFDPDFPEYGSFPYEAIDLGSGNGYFQGEFSPGDLNTANFYFSATDDAGNAATSETISMTGKDCGPVVR